MSDRYENIRRALAMGPTPGPWDLKDGRTDTIENVQGYPVCTVSYHPDGRYGHGVRAAYIAACDPDTIAALLKERDQEKSRADSLAEQVRHDYARIAALLKERDALLKDAERLDWLADNLVVEGFVAVSKDIYEFATDAAEKEGREEPTQSDQRAGLRLLIDAALADGENSDGL